MPTASGVPDVALLWTAATLSDPRRGALLQGATVVLAERNGYVSSMRRTDHVAARAGAPRQLLSDRRHDGERAGDVTGWEHLSVARFVPLVRCG